MNILNAQRKQRQQNDHGFLLVPGNVIHNGQVVDAFQAERLLQFERNHGQRIRVVALPGIQHTGYALDFTQVKFIVAELGAARR